MKMDGYKEQKPENKIANIRNVIKHESEIEYSVLV